MATTENKMSAFTMYNIATAYLITILVSEWRMMTSLQIYTYPYIIYATRLRWWQHSKILDSPNSRPQQCHR